MHNNHCAAAVARSQGIPLVTTTHGMLAQWAFKHKSWKKKIAWRLYQRQDIFSAAVLHVTAEHELRQLRDLGLRNPIAVIPIGIEVPVWKPRCEPKESRSVLFMGRIYPVKGLLNLVEAWKRVRRPGWKVVIAGPDESGHKAEVQQAIGNAGLSESFEFTGPVAGRGQMGSLPPGGSVRFAPRTPKISAWSSPRPSPVALPSSPPGELLGVNWRNANAGGGWRLGLTRWPRPCAEQ